MVLTGTSVDLGETAVLDSGLNILRDDPGEVEISSLDDLGRVEDNIYTAGSDAGTDTGALVPGSGCGGHRQIHVVDHLTGLTVSRENSTDALTSLTLEPGDQVQLTAQGTYWSRAAMRDVGAISWTVEGSIGSITEDGLFTAEGPGAPPEPSPPLPAAEPDHHGLPGELPRGRARGALGLHRRGLLLCQRPGGRHLGH